MQFISEPRPVLLVPHDPAWEQLALLESFRIAGVLGGELIAIHHIGSTAVPGIKAKPVIDLLGVVHSLQGLDEQTHLLEQLGYRARGEYGLPDRRYFSKPLAGTRTHHLHCFAQGDDNIDRHMRFRDYLRAHPETAAAYERLKEELAAKFPEDSAAYTEGKTEFIRQVEQS